MRRRRATLAVVAIVAAAAGAAAGAVSSDGGTASDPATASLAASLGNRQLAGERVIAGFAGHHHPTALIRRLIHSGRIAGVILFAENFDSTAGARRLVRRLQAINRPRALSAPR